MTTNYVRTADERVDVDYVRVKRTQYCVVRVWTGIQFEEVVRRESTLHEADTWADDAVAVLQRAVGVAMDDAREGA